MKNMKELKEMLIEQIHPIIEKGDITPEELKNVGEAVDVIKDIITIEAMERSDEGYSQANGNSYMRSYRGNMYDDGYSGRMYDDGMYGGMYNRQGNSYARNRGYMERRSYGRDEATDKIISKLESMIDEATTEKERMALVNCLEKMGN